MRPGPKNLITDIAGLRVGNAGDAELKSGVTCVTADAPFVAAVDVRGGAPGTRETDLLAPDRLVDRIDALVLSGGSAFGLDAASGVSDRLVRLGRGYPVGPHHVPIVPAAILADLNNGGDKKWGENPYRALGARAFDAAAADFEIGTFGAGTGALAGRLKGGLGSASVQLEDGTTVAALVAVNSLGTVVVPSTRHFWAAPFEEGSEFGGLGAPHRAGRVTAEDLKLGAEPGPLENTTIAIVATDAVLDKAGAQRLAVSAQDGLARSIVPAHTPFDGDLVFSLATGAVPGPVTPRQAFFLGHAAASCLARAVARAVYSAVPAPGDTRPCWSDLPP